MIATESMRWLVQVTLPRVWNIEAGQSTASKCGPLVFVTVRVSMVGVPASGRMSR